jgi:hypothetical protein
MSKPEPLVVADSDLITNTLDWITTPEMFPLDSSGLPYPRWTLDGIAQTFWGKSVDRMRLRVREHYFTLSEDEDCYHYEINGLPGFARDNRPKKLRKWYFDENMVCARCKGVDWGNLIRAGGMDIRYYTLASVERMAVVDTQKEGIMGGDLQEIWKIVKLIAQRHKLPIK